jgi:ferritin
MIKPNLLKVLSDQVNAEFYSAYLYLAMSAGMDRAGYKGIANWLYVQAQEEKAHATHIYEYILERGESPEFLPVAAPEGTFDVPLDVFEKVLAHEQKVTGLINNIASIAMAEGDHATYQFISWYVNEQVEEESTADNILTKAKFISENKILLYDLDTELGTRTFTDPFANAAT